MSFLSALNELLHSGIPQPYDNAPMGSGRYRKGTGESSYQKDSGTFLASVKKMKDAGMSETDIAKSFGMKTTEFRNQKSLAKANYRKSMQDRAAQLKDKGYSNTKIGEIMGINESSVRMYLNPVMKERNDRTQVVANVLKDAVDNKKYIDIGTGTELDNQLACTRTRLSAAVQSLKDQGYKVNYIKVEQATMPGQFTSLKVLSGPDSTWKEVNDNKDKITTVTSNISKDDNKTVYNMEFPAALDSNRVYIRYGDVGGKSLDGTIYLRRGVEDISLGNSSYAQVRVNVDNTHYLKGMAMYSDDIPKGYDVVYNTNKKSGTPAEKVFKELKTVDVKNPDGTMSKEIDKDNPFGAVIKPMEAGGQRHYIDSKTGEEKLGLINKVKDEGDWADYSKSLASQMLSKQSNKLIKSQLDLSYADKKSEYDEICSLTNPTVKRKLLESFADDCDAKSVDLKAAALPRQSTKVILPVPELKDTEIYAPTYKNGETVALIRYPHGGTFEIPVLKVNNKQADAKKLLENAPDAVGINAKVAERLSGADFDGDTVVVIPCNSGNSKVKITSTPALKDLKDFDSKDYKFTDEQLAAGAKVISNRAKQVEMGKVSNLITDMTLMGAKEEELARAVKHSMVVIDAEKHKLDYKKSEDDNNIKELKEKYQNGGGAATIISRAKGKIYIPEREEGMWVTPEGKKITQKQYIDPTSKKKVTEYYDSKGNLYEGKKKRQYIDPETGEKLYSETGRIYTDPKTGKEKVAQEQVTKMSYYKDANDLVSKAATTQEKAYANYANKLKALANTARKEYLATEDLKYSPEAKAKYTSEVNSLNSKLTVALKNAPKERMAQLAANQIVTAKKADNPDMTKEEIRKASAQALGYARGRLGAQKQKIEVTDKEWEAIQAGAISASKLKQILDNSNMDTIKQKAMPRSTTTLSQAKVSQIRAMSAAGYTIAEIADRLGVSTSTVSSKLK